MGESRTTAYIVMSSIKGLIHSIIIPFCLLWGFGKYGKVAIAISLSYIVLVGMLYFFSSKKKLSGAIFFGILKAFFVFFLLLGTTIGFMIIF